MDDDDDFDWPLPPFKLPVPEVSPHLVSDEDAPAPHELTSPADWTLTSTPPFVVAATAAAVVWWHGYGHMGPPQRRLQKLTKSEGVDV